MRNAIIVLALVGIFSASGCGANKNRKLIGALEDAAAIATGPCGQKVAAAVVACAEHIPTK